MLEILGKDSPFSPSAIQASLQTSTVQVRNGTNGVKMTLIKKCDVKMHFSSRRDRGLHLVQQVNKRDMDALPVADVAIESTPVFGEDFSLEHSSPGGTVSAVVMSTDSDDTQMPETHGTPQT